MGFYLLCELRDDVENNLILHAIEIQGLLKWCPAVESPLNGIFTETTQLIM